MAPPSLSHVKWYLILGCLALMGSSIDARKPFKAGNHDEVTGLPGLNSKLNFKQYSGFLVPKSLGKPTNISIHYWLVESQSNKDTDPLVVWTGSGYPGCSNMLALFTQVGPLRLEKNGSLSLNAHAWNRRANMLFMDAPVGVGYSSLLNGSDTDKYTSDSAAVSQIAAALDVFFDKFPEYRKRELYLTGQFVSGVYLPQLANHLAYETSYNIKGIAVGNGLMNLEDVAAATIMQAYYDGYIGEDEWQGYSAYCCDNNPPSKQKCSLFSSDPCMLAVRSIIEIIDQTGLDPNNMKKDCENPNGLSSSPMFGSRIRERNSKRHNSKGVTHRMLKSSQLCISYNHLDLYMNQEEVRKAIHVPKSLQHFKFTTCDQDITNQFELSDIDQNPTGMRDQFKKLLNSKRKVKVLFYNGESDYISPMIGVSWFADELGAKPKKVHQPWYINEKVAGFMKEFEGVTFMTIKGAGQRVAVDKPMEALEFFENYALRSNED